MTDGGSHAERHARAAETFEIFVPGVDPERVYASLSRRLGALGTFAFDVVGEMWARPGLSRRDRSLIVVSVLAAQARDEELELHTQIGVRNGLTRAELEEIVLNVAAYAGFPAAMAASRTVDAGLRAAEGVETLSDRVAAPPKDDDQREKEAAEMVAVILGRPVGSPTDDLAALSADLGGVGVTAYRWSIGEIWTRTEMSRRDRSLSVIAILTALGDAEELSIHVPAGTRNGLTQAEIEEAITHLTLYAGVPRAAAAMKAARHALDDTGT